MRVTKEGLRRLRTEGAGADELRRPSPWFPRGSRWAETDSISCCDYFSAAFVSFEGGGNRVEPPTDLKRPPRTSERCRRSSALTPPSTTRTCPSQSGPAPMPMGGMASRSVILAASGRGMHSSTILNAPASKAMHHDHRISAVDTGNDDEHGDVEDRFYTDNKYQTLSGKQRYNL